MAIILTGSLARDRLMQFDGEFTEVILPNQLEKLSLGLLLSDLRESWGGVAGNIAYSLGLLKETPLLLGAIGKDGESRRYIQRLAKRGVNTTSVHWSDLPTATFSAITDRHQRQFAGFYPGAMRDLPENALRESVTRLEKAGQWDVKKSIVMISPHDPGRMMSQVHDCAQQHWRMAFDVGQQIPILAAEDLRTGILAAEILFLNEYELTLLLQKIAWTKDVLTRQLRTLIVTLGERGCEVITEFGQKRELVPAIAGVVVADPTGAGDAFRGGFVYGLQRNWPAAVCAKLGNVVAAYAVEHHGTQEHHFTLSQLRRRFRQRYNQELPE